MLETWIFEFVSKWKSEDDTNLQFSSFSNCSLESYVYRILNELNGRLPYWIRNHFWRVRGLNFSLSKSDRFRNGTNPEPQLKRRPHEKTLKFLSRFNIIHQTFIIIMRVNHSASRGEENNYNSLLKWRFAWSKEIYVHKETNLIPCSNE